MNGATKRPATARNVVGIGLIQMISTAAFQCGMSAHRPRSVAVTLNV